MYESSSSESDEINDDYTTIQERNIITIKKMHLDDALDTVMSKIIT